MIQMIFKLVFCEPWFAGLAQMLLQTIFLAKRATSCLAGFQVLNHQQAGHGLNWLGRRSPRRWRQRCLLVVLLSMVPLDCMSSKVGYKALAMRTRSTVSIARPKAQDTCKQIGQAVNIAGFVCTRSMHQRWVEENGIAFFQRQLNVVGIKKSLKLRVACS